jgi:uncharacterized membrane protein
MNKKAMEISELGKWIFFVIALLVMITLIMIFGRKGGGLIEAMSQVLRFGGR